MSKDCLCRTGTTQILFDKDSVKESFFKHFQASKDHSAFGLEYEVSMFGFHISFTPPQINIESENDGLEFGR